ncbi:hypothetical protein RHO14_06375 [Orbus wheelerorum]|uniref:hypothetical protein n=1 Tax=Orbus wheelerorum TaxID=3074111 RepID=UPI00370D1F15
MANTMTSDLIITPIDKSLSFTEIKDHELIKIIIPSLSMKSSNDRRIYNISPLVANATAKLKNNQIIVQVNISNNQYYAWFLNKDDHLYFYLNGGKDIYHFTNSNFILPGNEIGIRRIISDNDYRLIRPNETLTFQRELSAEELYKNWRGQDIFIDYYVMGIPPSISKSFEQLYDNGEIERVYSDYLISNQVRIRCYGYDKEHDQYQCDIDNNDHTQFR